MKIAEYKTLAIIVGLALLAPVVIAFQAFAGTIESDYPAVEKDARFYTFLNATTTTAISTSVDTTFDASGRRDDGTLNVAGAEKVTFYFGRGDTTGQGNTGLTVFDVDVSPDGTNWYDFNHLIANDVSNTATTTVTINAATSTVIYSMDLQYDAFKFVRCTATETTDGEHTCQATVEY